MGYLLGIYCIISMFVFYTITKKIMNPASIINFWWGISIIVSTFGFFGINIPKESTYFTFFVGMFSYNAGVLLCIFLINNKVLSQNKLTEFERDHTLKLTNQIISVALFLSLLVIMIRSIKVFRMVNFEGYSYENIRYYYFYSELIISGYGHLVNQYFIVPIIITATTFYSYQLIVLKIKKWYVFCMLTILIFLHAYSSGGRSIFIYVFISLLVTVIMTSDLKNNKSILKQTFLITLGSGILLALLYALTIFRGGDSFGEILRTSVLYFTGSYIYFESILVYQISSQHYLYGAGFFGGIVDSFGLIKLFLGLGYISSASVISEFNQLYIEIGNYNFFNAFPTLFYTFMYDYGLLGVLIGSFIFGYFSLLVYSLYMQKPSFSNLLLYVVVIILIYESTMRWYGVFATPWIIILFAFIVKIVDYKKNRSEQNE